MADSLLSAAAQQLIQDQKVREGEYRERLRLEFGSTKAFVERLGLEVFDDPGSPLLDPFYALYERCFPLAEEREPVEGFRRVLSLNRDKHAQRAFGPAQEYVATALHPETSEVLAAANYVVMRYAEHDGFARGFAGSCQLNFLCVAPDFRGAGIADHMLGVVYAETARKLAEFTGQREPAWFTTIEQNNPARMTSEEIESDATAALIDPDHRSRWWSMRGYRELDFVYTQPPLSTEHEACTYIDYFAKLGGAAPAAAKLPAAALLEHLRRFFFISVGKLDMDMEANEHWLAQKRHLQSVAEVDLEPLRER